MTGEKRLYDYLGSFPKGHNSSIDPLLLPKDELAFLSNGTNRGDFVTQRPSFNTLTLANVPTAFNTGLFQGWAYFNPSSGNEFLMVVVAGKLFQITITGTSGYVTQVALPDAGNSTTTPIQWMWQSERWLIWNDGINLPMYYDGNTARRSLGETANNSLPLASTATSFTAPSSNQSVFGDVQLTGPYTGPIGATVLINTAVYYVKAAYTGGAVSGYVKAQLAAITGLGDLLAPGASLSTNSQIMGCILSAKDSNGGVVHDWPTTYTPPQQFTISMMPNGGYVWPIDYTHTLVYCGSTPVPFPGSCVQVGQIITVNGQQCYVDSFTSAPSAGVWQVTSITCHPLYQSATGVAIGPSTVVIPGISNIAWQDTVCGTNYSGVLNSSTLSFTLPAINPNTSAPIVYGTMYGGLANETFTLTLTQPFTGSTGDTLQVGSGGIALMTVLSYNGSQVTCQMVNSNASGLAIPFYVPAATPPPPTTPTTLQIVWDTTVAPSLTQVVSYPLNDGTSPTPNANLPYPLAATMNFPNSTGYSALYPSAPPNTVQVGQIIQVTSGTGLSDLLYVAELGAVQVAPVYGQSTYWLELINQTDTPGVLEAAGSPIYPIPELPVGKMGVYAQGRNWMCKADGQSFIASDMVGSSSGSSTNNYLDAVLNVSQNQQLAGGGTFVLPGAATQIRAMLFLPTLDVSLGQGPVQILTQNTVFSCSAPADMTTWAQVTNPIVTVSLIGSGAVSQDSAVTENCDLFFRSPEGFIRSLILARLDFNQWGNTPASREVVRSLQNDNLSLLMYDSSTVFNNRLLYLCQPTQYARGVGHAAMVSLNFDALSTIQDKQPSVWEAEWESPPSGGALGLKTGFFESVERCFILVLNSGTSQLELHEILQDGAAIYDDSTGGTPSFVSWAFESPMLFKDKPNGPRAYKRLINGEFSISGVQSNVNYNVYYKSDQYPNWVPWYGGVITYALGDPGFRSRVPIGMPAAKLFDPTNNRPLREGYNFQIQFAFSGYCKFLSARFAADEIPEPEFGQPK